MASSSSHVTRPDRQSGVTVPFARCRGVTVAVDPPAGPADVPAWSLWLAVEPTASGQILDTEPRVAVGPPEAQWPRLPRSEADDLEVQRELTSVPAGQGIIDVGDTTTEHLVRVGQRAFAVE